MSRFKKSWKALKTRQLTLIHSTRLAVSHIYAYQSYFGNPALEVGDRFTTNGKTALLTGYTWKFGGLQTLESASYTPETLSDTTRTDKVANVAKTTAEKAKLQPKKRKQKLRK